MHNGVEEQRLLVSGRTRFWQVPEGVAVPGIPPCAHRYNLLREVGGRARVSNQRKEEIAGYTRIRRQDRGIHVLPYEAKVRVPDVLKLRRVTVLERIRR